MGKERARGEQKRDESTVAATASSSSDSNRSSQAEADSVFGTG